MWILVFEAKRKERIDLLPMCRRKRWEDQNGWLRCAQANLRSKLLNDSLEIPSTEQLWTQLDGASLFKLNWWRNQANQRIFSEIVTKLWNRCKENYGEIEVWNWLADATQRILDQAIRRNRLDWKTQVISSPISKGL